MTVVNAQAASLGDDNHLRREGERIAQLIDDLGTIGGAPVRDRADELVGRLIYLYGAGLAQLINILSPGTIDDAAKARLAADPLVSSLLVLHGLHPDPETARTFDPGPAPPTPAPPDEAGRLVQIDLGHRLTSKIDGAP